MSLGCGAYMNKLERVRGSGFSIEECITLDEFLQKDLRDTVIPADKAVKNFPSVVVTVNQAKRFKNGNELDLKSLL